MCLMMKWMLTRKYKTKTPFFTKWPGILHYERKTKTRIYVQRDLYSVFYDSIDAEAGDTPISEKKKCGRESFHYLIDTMCLQL